ncbi:hypothetical protein EX30DRAFT_374276 [Ascodesmis nigricans]|uniref:Uncharacterized protein n=1 Tax=Ascodesmis nigricans TaxID=341454 RepID=A0A4S2MRV3_9PEZI|nr:hypothetical protein EX30DRAFT_374276 [Ascodesmis nigricans]
MPLPQFPPLSLTTISTAVSRAITTLRFPPTTTNNNTAAECTTTPSFSWGVNPSWRGPSPAYLYHHSRAVQHRTRIPRSGTVKLRSWGTRSRRESVRRGRGDRRDGRGKNTNTNINIKSRSGLKTGPILGTATSHLKLLPETTPVLKPTPARERGGYPGCGWEDYLRESGEYRAASIVSGGVEVGRGGNGANRRGGMKVTGTTKSAAIGFTRSHGRIPHETTDTTDGPRLTQHQYQYQCRRRLQPKPRAGDDATQTLDVRATMAAMRHGRKTRVVGLKDLKLRKMRGKVVQKEKQKTGKVVRWLDLVEGEGAVASEGGEQQPEKQGGKGEILPVKPVQLVKREMDGVVERWEREVYGRE